MALQAGLVLRFGISDPNELYGLVQTFEKQDTVQRAEAIAPDGHAVSIQEFNSQATLSLTYIPLNGSSTEQPEIGTSFDFDGLPWQIDNISDVLTVDGFEAKTIDAHWYPKIH
jgi:hypothetical protein